MNCLKCGKEIGTGQVFCPECLQVMDSYPVEPGTPIHIPQRSTQPERAPRRSKTGYADSIRALRKVIKWLCAALAALTLIICALTGYLIYTLNTQDKTDAIGKNYTAVETNTQP